MDARRFLGILKLAGILVLVGRMQPTLLSQPLPTVAPSQPPLSLTAVDPKGLADCAGSREAQLECWFRRGLADQERAEEEPSGEERRRLLEASKDSYLRAYELDSQSGGVLNNLAVVLSLLGGEKNDAAAREYFEKAVRLDHRLRPFYHRNYADFLRDRKDYDGAVSHYRAALNEEPQDYQAYQSLMGLFADNPEQRQERLPEILWFLAGKGQIAWSEETALQELRRPGLPPEWRREMLTILAFSLGNDAYLPAEFAGSPSGKALNELANDPEVGPGAQEILQLHAGERLDPDRYPWWNSQPRQALSTGGTAPLEAFQNLIRGLGASSEKTGDSRQAERYLLLSALLATDKADVVASDRLADLGANTGRIVSVQTVVERNEPALKLLGAEGGLDVLRYRQDVSLLLGNHGILGNENTPFSAIYQFARAKELTEKILLPRAGGSPVKDFDARMYTRLAEGYGATHQPEKAGQTLQELVGAFEVQGLKKEANALLAVLNSGQRSRRPTDRRREFLDDPPQSRDFTTQPPGRPQ
jgi:tetratricopeptide (TPR) repeat protein